MGKRFRLRISRIIFCGLLNRDNRNNINNNPNISFSSISPATPTVNPHRGSAIKRHVSSALGSCGLTVGSRPTISSDDEHNRTESMYKEENFRPVAEITELPRRKIYNSSADENDVGFEFVFPAPRGKHRKRRRKKRRASVRVSTSSIQSALFSDETETLVSSTDDSSSHRRRNGSETATKRCVSTGHGKVMSESFAVVKRSNDPCADFKRSMAEMILEKQMFEDEDLEQLLHCFLSLNSRNHHGDIVRAFIETWEALFSASSRNGSARSSRRISLAM